MKNSVSIVFLNLQYFRSPNLCMFCVKWELLNFGWLLYQKLEKSFWTSKLARKDQNEKLFPHMANTYLKTLSYAIFGRKFHSCVYMCGCVFKWG